MNCLTRCLFFLACLLLLATVVPPQPALAGDPDEIIERTPVLPPRQPATPPLPDPPGGLRGDPDEMPDGNWGEEGGGPGGLDFPGGGSGLRGAGGWIPVLLEALRIGVLVAY
jgi:hypothetical protein